MKKQNKGLAERTIILWLNYTFLAPLVSHFSSITLDDDSTQGFGYVPTSCPDFELSKRLHNFWLAIRALDEEDLYSYDHTNYDYAGFKNCYISLCFASTCRYAYLKEKYFALKSAVEEQMNLERRWSLLFESTQQYYFEPSPPCSVWRLGGCNIVVV